MFVLLNVDPAILEGTVVLIPVQSLQGGRVLTNRGPTLHPSPKPKRKT